MNLITKSIDSFFSNLRNCGFLRKKRKDIATPISKMAGRRALKTKFSPPPGPLRWREENKKIHVDIMSPRPSVPRPNVPLDQVSP